MPFRPVTRNPVSENTVNNTLEYSNVGRERSTLLHSSLGDSLISFEYEQRFQRFERDMQQTILDTQREILSECRSLVQDIRADHAANMRELAVQLAALDERTSLGNHENRCLIDKSLSALTHTLDEVVGLRDRVDQITLKNMTEDQEFGRPHVTYMREFGRPTPLSKGMDRDANPSLKKETLFRSNPGREHSHNFQFRSVPDSYVSRDMEEEDRGRGQCRPSQVDRRGMDSPKLEPYSGKEPWRDFYGQFQRHRCYKNWSYEEAALFLGMHLKGEALHFFEQLPSDQQRDFQASVRALESRFGHAISAETQRTRFHNLSQHDKESQRIRR